MILTKKYRILHTEGVILGGNIEFEESTTTEFSEDFYSYFETDSKEEADKYISENNLKYLEL